MKFPFIIITNQTLKNVIAAKEEEYQTYSYTNLNINWQQSGYRQFYHIKVPTSVGKTQH